MKEKEKNEHVWCITCKMKGHQKEEFPTFVQYMATGEENPLEGGVGYCEICNTWGHHICFSFTVEISEYPKKFIL
jgi:hypothetical protein